ncbi:MAG: serine hydrolase domain-containing protein [Phycisphaerales bacterium JB043]
MVDSIGCGRLRLILAIGLSVLALVTSASGIAQDVERGDALVKSVLDEDDLPSISVAVARDGEIVYARAFGASNLEGERLVTSDTQYAIGSISKSITAIIALQLEQGGMLDLDTPIREYCSDLPESMDGITSRQLLAHTGGIRHYDYRRFQEDFMNTHRFESLEEALGKFVGDPLIGEPGSQHEYTSWGYVLLGRILECASGVSYDELLEARLVRPLHLEATGLDIAGEENEALASGYYTDQSGAITPSPYFDSSDRYPAGGLRSTPTELVTIGNALLGDDLMSSDSRDVMWTESRLKSGESIPYGLGWRINSDDNTASHGGTSAGTTTFLYVEPDTGIVIAFATNLSRWGRDRYALARELASLYRD